MIFNKKFGRFRLVKKLATGGMAEVMLAVRPGPGQFEKFVALKMMLPHLADDVSVRRLFMGEARVGALLKHPNLVEVFDLEEVDGRPVMVMDFVPGHTVEELAARCRARGRSLSARATAMLVRDTARGLAAAHELRDLAGTPLSVVHRDISPHNVLVGYDGRVRLFDFGLATMGSGGAESGNLAGKTAYMSPEQCRGVPIDARSDIFALGIVLHELLTARSLFRRENHIQSIRAITEEEVPSPTSIQPEVPAGLSEIALRALAREPEARFATAGLLADALDAWISREAAFASGEELRGVMQECFRNEEEELLAVIAKVRSAPEQNEATVDLASFEFKPSAPAPVAAPLQPPRTSTISDDAGGGLVALAQRAPSAPEPAAPEPLAGLAPEPFKPVTDAATAALGAQLAAARRNVWIASAIAALALVGVVGIMVQRSAGVPSEAPVTSAEAPAAVSRVVVETQPPGAVISVDGVVRAEATPAELLLAADKAVTLSLAKPGYVTVTESLTPKAGAAAVISRPLVIDPNSPEAPIGSVRVVYTPPEATVFVDGVLEGSGSPVLVDNLTLNAEHTLRLAADGYESIFFPFKLDSRDVLEVQLQMAKAVALGKVRIVSEPPGAEVWIAGERAGVTPLDDFELPASQSYTVELRKDGFVRWRGAIVVRQGENPPVDVRLRGAGGGAPPAAAESEAPAKSRRGAGAPRRDTANPNEPNDDGKYPLLLGQ